MMNVGTPARCQYLLYSGESDSPNMIDGNKLAIVLEDHDLMLGVAFLRVLPVVDGYLDSFRAVFTWHMKYATPWCEYV